MNLSSTPHKYLKCWTTNDTICFSDGFDEPFNNYFPIMRNYPNMHFVSQYKYMCNYPTILTKNLKQLIFRHIIFQQLILTKNIESLTLYECEGLCSKFPRKMVYLKYYYHKSPPIILTKNVHTVEFYVYNLHMKLPKGIRHVTFDVHFDQPIDLTKNLTRIKFGAFSNKPIRLGTSIKNITLDGDSLQHIVIEKPIDEITVYAERVRPSHFVFLDNLPNGSSTMAKANTTVINWYTRKCTMFYLNDPTGIKSQKYKQLSESFTDTNIPRANIPNSCVLTIKKHRFL